MQGNLHVEEYDICMFAHCLVAAMAARADVGGALPTAPLDQAAWASAWRGRVVSFKSAVAIFRNYMAIVSRST